MRELMEAGVKRLVKRRLDKWLSWSFAPVSNGMGAHGIPDRIACVPVVVTQDMVGGVIGRFVAIESKRPGRRNEEDRGASKNQVNQMNAINAAGGVALVCDGEEDLQIIELRLRVFRNG